MENKSIGGALVDVFDAAVTLVRSEINAVARRVGNIAKAKGLGVVLLLASLVPLTLALIFLILFVFYGLMRLGLGAWAAALLIGVLSLAVTAALIFLGLKRLGSDVPDDTDPSGNGPGKLSDIARDDAKYGGAARTEPIRAEAAVTGMAARAVSTETGHTTGGHPVVQDIVHTAGGSGAHKAATSQPPTVAASGVQEATVAASPDHAPRPGHLNSTSTEGKPAGESEKTGIEVSTHPTYQSDMKKEGY